MKEGQQGRAINIDTTITETPSYTQLLGQALLSPNNNKLSPTDPKRFNELTAYYRSRGLSAKDASAYAYAYLQAAQQQQQPPTDTTLSQVQSQVEGIMENGIDDIAETQFSKQKTEKI